MIKILYLHCRWRYVWLTCALLTLTYSIANAQARKSDFQGNYSNELKGKMDIVNAKLGKNLASYKKDKSVAHLDESYNMIIQSVDEMDTYLKTATQHLQDIPETAELEKLKAQVDKLEVITIRDSELPYLCEQLYEVGQFYVKTDKRKAKRCFNDIVQKFTSYESESCSKKAEVVLEHLN